MEFLRLLLRFIPQFKWRITSYIFLNILGSICSVFSFIAVIPLIQILFKTSEASFIYKNIGDAHSVSEFSDIAVNNIMYYLQEQIVYKGEMWVLTAIGLFIVGMSLLHNIITYFAYWVRIPIRTGISRDLRNDAYEKITNMQLGDFAKENRGDFVSRMTSDVEETDYGIGVTLDMLIMDPVKIGTYMVAMIGISPKLTFYAISMLSIVCVVILILGQFMQKISHIAQNNRGKILSIFEQTLGALTIIKSYNAQQLFSDKFKVVNEYAQKIFNKQNRYYSIAWPSADFSMTLVIVIMLCVGGKLILTGQSDINPATFIGFLVVFYSIISPLRDIMKCSFGIRKAMASVSRLNKILKIEEELDNKVNSKHLSTENISSILKIENLSFGYSSEEQTLNDINIEINSSEKIAIIGETGSGKSTLIHLINRLYDNYDGNIFLQGVNIKKVPRANSRRKIAYVPQKPMLFNDTILDNITLKDDNITIDKVVSVTKKIGIHDFIVSLPEKYNTIIGDQGCSISGGQQQCISIARAMVRESSILIIDEGTSALDPKLESTILNDLIYKEDNKTVIIVTHKISSVLNVDRIFVIKNGKVIENGTPKELYKKGGVFRNLALYQNVTL